LRLNFENSNQNGEFGDFFVKGLIENRVNYFTNLRLLSQFGRIGIIS
jgi:hypothetical protein